ncbi:low molecular weight protein tyrosine phosphatase family protein [Undibacterium danionis]|uniref:Low molecular weight protein tyrosine phosphatase family protein n=1 Tax=Undibacterium danionis TaxID=1812100 RepID=A0ABV6IE54_9BURK
MKRALFICTQNRLRSPTAEQIFASWPDVETDSAGLGNDANTPLSSEQIAWANIIFVMEKTHRSKLSKKFRPYLSNKRIICLDIPDDYEFMDPVLISILKVKVGKFLI